MAENDEPTAGAPEPPQEEAKPEKLAKDKKPSNAPLFESLSDFAVELNGVPTVVHKGDLARQGHPVLKRRSELFKPFDPTVRFEKD